MSILKMREDDTKERTGLLRSAKGQTMIEYALIAVLIAIVLVFAFNIAGVSSGISASGSKVSSALQ